MVVMATEEEGTEGVILVTQVIDAMATAKDILVIEEDIHPTDRGITNG